jgi:hypothetical protein
MLVVGDCATLATTMHYSGAVWTQRKVRIQPTKIRILGYDKAIIRSEHQA